MKTDDKKFHNYSLSFFQKQAQLSEVSNRVKIGFHNFQRHEKALKNRTIELFLKFSSENKIIQKQLLVDDSQGYIDSFFDIIKCLNSDRDLMEFVLPTLDAILTEQRVVLRQIIQNIKKTKDTSILKYLKSLLVIDDHRDATYQSAARILSILYGQLPKDQFKKDQKQFLLDLLQLRKSPKKQKITQFCLMTCLVHLNKHQELAQVFLENDGGSFILSALQHYSNEVQLLYYSFLNIWMLSFIKIGIQDFISVPKFGVIRHICEVLQKISRQKLVRVAFAIFKNLENNHNCLELMMDNKLLKIIDTILKGNIKENQLVDSIKAIGQTLEANIRVLSSFDKYCRQVNAQSLQWSSVHTERFWKENVLKFQLNDYQMIKKLRQLLSHSNKLNQAIACYDFGEFCRFYPRGRTVLQSLQIKNLIMEKARYSEDKAVRQQALLALQKLMIQNWQNI